MTNWIVTVIQYGAIAALGVVLVFIARHILRTMEGPRRVLTPEIMAAEGDMAAAAETTRDKLIREQVNKYVEDSPEDVSRLLEGWIEGEE